MPELISYHIRTTAYFGHWANPLLHSISLIKKICYTGSRPSCVPAFRGFMLFCLKLPVSHYIPTVSYRLFDKHVFMSFRFYAWKNPLYSLLWKVIFHSLCTVTLSFIPYKSVLSVTETGWNEYKKWIFCSNYYIMRIIICIFVARINKRSFGKVW